MNAFAPFSSVPHQTAAEDASAVLHVNGNGSLADPAHAHLNGKSASSSASADLSDSAAIDRFQQFLRIPTITVEGPTGKAHRAAIAWLTHIATVLGAEHHVYEYTKGFPVFVLTLAGSAPELPSILLNSHYDVVPVMTEHWHHDPFSAALHEGSVVARGAQDMKCVCVQYLEALLRLTARGWRPLRTVHASFMPDEETGGFHGMAKWIEAAEFRALNVGFALDEGLANTADVYTVFYGERAVWWTRILATGPTGHGSRLIAGTATEKLHRVIAKLLAFRATQVEKLNSLKEAEPGCAHATCKKHELGDVVTVNLTMLKAGVSGDGGKSYSINVIPMHAEAAFDIRIPPSVPLADFEAQLRSYTEAEEGVSYDFFQKVKVHSATSIDPAQNPYWKTFASVLSSLGRTIDPQIFPAGTDGRYLREIGIPVLGFSPMRLQPILLHDHDERLSADCYLDGVKVYEALIPALSDNVE